MPIEKFENGAWLHASRLPLGGGWSGRCTAPGHENEVPSQEELQDFCNLGYAQGCNRLPPERIWDSVRFAAKTVCSRKNGNRQIQVRYICERGHRPADHGFLEFDVAGAKWLKAHPDLRVQRLAECFMASYLEGRKTHEVAQPAAS
jgi:hypothetical protein